MLDPSQRPNSSLSWERVELCRRLNEIFDEHGWPDRLRRRTLQGAIIPGLRDAGPSASDVRIPPVSGQHLRRTSELSASRIDLLTSSGIDVIGDPGPTRVQFDEGAAAAPTEPPVSISIEAVAAAVEQLMIQREASR
jgi:hypothetical protein